MICKKIKQKQERKNGISGREISEKETKQRSAILEEKNQKWPSLQANLAPNERGKR